jgi:putative ABC transport system permease protein
VTSGLALALAVATFMTAELYGVAPLDPLTLLSASVFLGLVALLASYLPAWRASRVDPLIALRTD